jgi:hypothetical protein
MTARLSGPSSLYPQLFPILLICIVQLLLASSVSAQAVSGTLNGVVHDQNGDVVPGASVTVTNAGIGFQRKTTTNENGAFVIPLLPPSTYTVSVERDGFAPAEILNVVLNVGDQKSLKISLSAGTISEQVKVVDTPSLVNESPTAGTLVDRQFVENLPLNGRSFQSLLTLTPGVVLTKANSGNTGQFSVNGQRSDSNYFLVDGVSANVGVSAEAVVGQAGAGSLPALSVAGGTSNLVSVDALEEFKVLTSTFAPEYGRMPGGQVSIVTRSGTNSFHGAAFDYVRNDVFDANDWFANANRLERPALRQNDFGAVIGGPIYLPHFGEGGPKVWSGKDKTFFFFSYEGLRLRQPLTSISQVPSLASRQAAIPVIQPFLNAFPLPNGANTTLGMAILTASYSNPTTLDATSIRIDHNFSSKLTAFARYNVAPSHTVTRGLNGGVLSQISPTYINTRTLTFGSIYSITPTIVNDFRGNWSSVRGQQINDLDNFGGAVPVPDASYYPVTFTGQRNFTFSVTSATYQKGGFANNVRSQWNFTDSVLIVRGNHQVKVGIDWRRSLLEYRPLRINGQAVFNGATGALNGLVARGVIVTSKGPKDISTDNFSLYAQDAWKISPRLTLTYGLRWDLALYPKEKSGEYPQGVLGLDNPATMTFAPEDTPLWNTPYANFAPRVGVSYQLRRTPGRETVVRGGFGLFYDLPYGSLLSSFSNSWPTTGRKNLPANTPFPYSQAIATPLPLSTTPPATNLIVSDPDLELPLTYQWNFTVDQSLGRSQVLTVAYVGAAGRKLLRSETYINPNPNFQQVNVTRNGADSDYHSLQVQFNRRLTTSIQVLASYTWSHSIDTASSDSAAWAPGARIDPRTDRSSSDFDVRHSFNSALSYNIPTFSNAPLVKQLIRNWSIDSVFALRTATPVNVFTSTDVLGLGVPSISRPDLIAGVPLYIDDPNVAGGKRINRAAFRIPPANSGRQGSLGRNALRGFNIHQLDFALRRQVKLNERFRVQLKGELFNIFNHPNFADPDGSLGTDGIPNTFFGLTTSMFGRSLGSGNLSGGLNPLYQIGGPRSVQLSLKVLF